MTLPKKTRQSLYILLNLLWITGLVYFVIWLDRPETRYQVFSYHYSTIYMQKGTVDLVASGGSDILTMFNAYMLADLLKKRYHREFIIYDLSKNWAGTGIVYVMYRDLLKERSVRTLLVQWRPQDTYLHEYFFIVASFRDIVESAMARANWPLYKKLQEILAMIVDKSVWHLSRIILGQDWRVLNTVKTTARTSDDRTETERVVPDLVERARLQWAKGWYSRPGRSYTLEDPAEARSRYYYRKIVALAKQKNTKVIFLEYPFLFHPPISDEFKERLARTFAVEVFTLTRDQLNEIYPAGFADSAHANKFGQEFYMKWMSQILDY